MKCEIIDDIETVSVYVNELIFKSVDDSYEIPFINNLKKKTLYTREDQGIGKEISVYYDDEGIKVILCEEREKESNNSYDRDDHRCLYIIPEKKLAIEIVDHYYSDINDNYEREKYGRVRVLNEFNIDVQKLRSGIVQDPRYMELPRSVLCVFYF